MTAHRDKVVAYITHTDPAMGVIRLLVFTHVLSPDAGLQVPAGTMKLGESPLAAALRETQEESGLDDLEVVGILGERTLDLRPWDKDETHHRHFLHLRLRSTPPDTWFHHESDPDGLPGHPPIPFAFAWHPIVPTTNKLPDLAAQQGALLPALIRSLLDSPS